MRRPLTGKLSTIVLNIFMNKNTDFFSVTEHSLTKLLFLRNYICKILMKI